MIYGCVFCWSFTLPCPALPLTFIYSILSLSLSDLHSQMSCSVCCLKEKEKEEGKQWMKINGRHLLSTPHMKNQAEKEEKAQWRKYNGQGVSKHFNGRRREKWHDSIHVSVCGVKNGNGEKAGGSMSLCLMLVLYVMSLKEKSRVTIMVSSLSRRLCGMAYILSA